MYDHATNLASWNWIDLDNISNGMYTVSQYLAGSHSYNTNRLCPLQRQETPVSVLYTGIPNDGMVFDTNVNGTPLEFTVPRFEDAVVGMGIKRVRDGLHP